LTPTSPSGGAREHLTPAEIDKGPQEIPDPVVLGHKKPLPPNALQEITGFPSQGRTVLERYGYRFPIVYNATTAPMSRS
jgi:hypothetical protein